MSDNRHVNHYLITGGAGYIGSRLALSLAISGYSVRVFDNFGRAPKENITALLAPYAKRVEIIEGDILSEKEIEGALAGITHVVHLAGLSSVEESIAHPAEYMEANSAGTAAVLRAAHAAGNVARVVVGSSCAVYGESTAMSRSETNLAEPISPFGVSKLAAENLCKSFHKLYEFPVIALRFFNVYGPADDPGEAPQGFLASLCHAAARNQPAILHGNGEQTRDFIHIDDTVAAIRAACDAPRHVACGHVFNVGTGQRVSLNEAIEAVEKLLGRTVVVERVGLRPGDIRHSRAEITKAAGLLEFTASVPFHDGLARLLASYHSTASSQSPIAKAA